MTPNKSAQVAYEASAAIGRTLLPDGNEDIPTGDCTPWWLLSEEDKRKHVAKVRVIRESTEEQILKYINRASDEIEKIRRAVYVTVALETGGL